MTEKAPAKKPAEKPVGTMKTKITFEEALKRIEAIFKILRGQEDVRNRLSAILDPKNPKTSSNLTAEQINVIIKASYAMKTYPILYAPLGHLVEEIAPDMLSLDGWGVEQSIKLNGAIEQSAFLKGMFGSVQEKKSRLPAFRKGETKQ